MSDLRYQQKLLFSSGETGLEEILTSSFYAGVTRCKPFGYPNMGELFLPVMKQFLGKGND